MTRMLYLVGAPGVGKSTVVDGVVDLFGYTRGDPVILAEKMLWGEWLYQAEDEPVGVTLGKPHGVFPGTDRLDRRVSPEAREWVASATLPPLVIGEGSRLGNSKFLPVAAEHTDLLVVHLLANPDSLDARCDARPTALNPKFRSMAAAAARSATTAAAKTGAATVEIDTTEMTPAEVAEAVFCLL